MIDTELQERANRMEKALRVILVWVTAARKIDGIKCGWLLEVIEAKCREALR